VAERLAPIGYALILAAALWAVAVSLVIFFTPVQIHEISATIVPGGDQEQQETTQYASWYQVQGLWGTILLVIFAGLYILAVYLRRQSKILLLGILSVVTLALSYLAGLSIGMAYLPAALALLVGMILSALART
jgi:hypothetical protein